MYLGASPTCQANPPCQQGGSIVVGDRTVTLAPDVEVAGVGDNRIASRDGISWYSIFALPADFVVSGGTPEELHAEWVAREQARVPAGSGGPVSVRRADLLGLPWWAWVGISIGLVLLMRSRGVRSL
jgi:hypothetical protein